MPSKIGMAITMLTPENAAIKSALENSGADAVLVNDEREQFMLHALSEEHAGLDALLCRSSSFSRSLCLSFLLEQHGIHVMNSHASQQVCGDKVLCSAKLSKAGIPTPKVMLAFSAQSALAAASSMGYPCVIKPPIGSWGRMVYKVTDAECAQAVVGLKSSLGHFTDKIYYIQEYVDKPGRDIRVLLVGDEIALSVFRSASTPDAFLTNLNAGGTASGFSLSPEMAETVHKVGKLLGSGIYGIDLIEDKQGGFFVLEVNHSPEFSKSSGAKIHDVAQKIAAFAISSAKN
ncbi:MAG: RimK family alpha-L-glutamate ligase [Candidatus Micrarchaeia archaeon]|jgi:[lysine-biosynthesis-protein LysW]--L-2-aminoadipate ligase